MKRRNKFTARVRMLPLERVQLFAAEMIFFAYFLSVWKFKIWYVGTGAAVVITALIVSIPGVKIAELFLDVAPLAVYFVYLYVAAGWSEFADYARWWALADSVGILVFAVFWVAARNNAPADVIQSFVRISLLMVAALVVTYTPSPYATRFGGYTVPYIPAALPFIWAAIVRRMHRKAAALAFVVCLVVLLLSRSRAPLMAAAMVLGLSVLLIGRSLLHRIKLGAVLLLATLAIGAVLLAISPTRFFLLTFFSRITGRDVLTSDIYVAAENEDPIRGQLRDLVHDRILDVQPFGAGYMVTERYFERAYPEGYALHDLYQTWAFEGGIFCVVIVAVIFLRHLRGLAFARRYAMKDSEAVLARAIELATLAVLVMGLFHQMHHGPVFYSLLGLALGLRARVREHFAQPVPQPVLAQERAVPA